MIPVRLTLALGALAALALVTPSPIAAASGPAVGATLASGTGGVRIVVSVTSPKRPRAVSVVARRRTLRLTSTATKGRSSTWRSALQRGSAASRLSRASGKKVTVKLRIGARTMVRRVILGAPKPSGGGTTPTGPENVVPPPPAVNLEPVRDDARFGQVLGTMSFLRTYETGTATHSESYKFCPAVLQHMYEGFAYIYRSDGPWKVIEGSINTAGDKGSGTIEFVQQQANFTAEVGKVQTISLSWAAGQATIVHPEIGTYSTFGTGQNTC